MAFLAVVGAAILFAVFMAIPWMADACTTTKLEAGKALISGPGGCVEFWFNRYQTFFSALIAGVIAGIGAALLFRQTRATERQVASQRYEFLEKRIGEVRGLQSAGAALYKACAVELHPGRMIRHSGPPTWAKGSLMSAVETPIGDYRDCIEAGRIAVSNLVVAVERLSVSETVSRTAIHLHIEAHFFLNACWDDARVPVVNLGWGEQPPPPSIGIRSPASHQRFNSLMGQYGRLNEAVDQEIAALVERREQAKVVAM
ncbi:MAG: hypothetical protein K2Y56_23425 [Methylobacterium sp.]|uniref:hypothetical protein n=1 Tax=Methylobacterium sp. TaxID=409 RepID=UPI0025DD414F|nr:hypothetical protein [Methylobacterium sp.]MBX9934428.1 hypothetical protein [Methylobacterium sp.]